MVTPAEAREIALSFEGVAEKPHFHRTAFTVNGKIFATLLEKDSTLNLMFDVQTQFIFCRRIATLFILFRISGD